MRNSDKVLSIKNDSKISYTAKEIANEFLHRGSATREKIESTLRILKDEFGIKTLKNLAQEHIDKFVSNLKYKIESGNMSLSNANSYISSINNLVKYIGKDGNEELRAIKAKDYGLSRKFNDGINKENSRESAQAFKNWLNEKYQETKNIKYEALRQAVNIQSVNLRLRESLQVKLLNKDLSRNILKISAKGDGSKNGRAREINLTAEQKAVLTEARIFMKENNLKNLNIGTLKQGRDFANNALKAFRS
jgi:hypothetical protein